MGESFDYAKAYSRVEGELRAAIDAVWDNYLEYRKNLFGVPESPKIYSNWTLLDKANSVLMQQEFMKDTLEKKRISMLTNIVNTSFWHVTDNFGDILPTLSPDDVNFYSNLVITQATLPNSRTIAKGYSWIVQQYDYGVLRRFIPPELLAEAVNKGFWELAREYLSEFAGATVGYVFWNIYNTLMKYPQHLDLTRFEEFGPVTLHAAHGWPDAAYIKAYNTAKNSGKLDQEKLGFLACPIIELMVYVAYCGIRDFDDNFDSKLKAGLQPYSDVLGTSPVKEMLCKHFVHSVKMIEFEYEDMMRARLVEPYLMISDLEKRKLASSTLTKERYSNASSVIRVGYPKEWLTEAAEAKLAADLVTEIDKLHGYRDFNSFITQTRLIKEGVELELLSKELAAEKMTRALTFYVESKRRPSGEVAIKVNSMDWTGYVTAELDKQVHEKALSDMLLRRVKTDKIASKNANAIIERNAPGASRNNGVQTSLESLEHRGAEKAAHKNRSTKSI